MFNNATQDDSTSGDGKNNDGTGQLHIFMKPIVSRRNLLVRAQGTCQYNESMLALCTGGRLHLYRARKTARKVVALSHDPALQGFIQNDMCKQAHGTTACNTDLLYRHC